MPAAQPVLVANLGFPRIGPRRQLKTALERFWSGRLDQAGLLQIAADLRREGWTRQAELGVDILPSNDFSLYDQVLDATLMVGAVPPRFAGAQGLELYFAMARGARSGEQETGCCGQDAVACEMTKWFDTNYHHLAPEVAAGQTFALASTKPVDEFLEARAQGHHTRPVLIGPVTWLKLAKAKDGSDPRDLLDALLPVYGEILRRLAAVGADWVQMDEPALALDLDDTDRAAFACAYERLALAAPGLKLMLTPYFAALDDNLDLALSLPVAGLHLDLVRGPGDLDLTLAKACPDLVLSLGVVDGRNVWRADLTALLDRLEPVVASGRRVLLAPSCSLLHAPLDLTAETRLDPEVASWLAFGVQKLEELALLARALNEGRASVADALAASDAALAARRVSPKVRDLAVQARMAAVTPQMADRAAPVAERLALQAKALNLPAYPTTTIGSFPQTQAVRKARADEARGRLEPGAYQAFLEDETRMAIRWQESAGLDVLVHGEFERNDMVQYFGEQLSGFAFTGHAWVQSYGSRCVRPPIIYGDVARPRPMTVEWWSYAQSLTVRPVKGMLTGPVTILQWSFVRDDIPRQETCRQIALAIRDEVADLEAAGAAIIQIDEAALREGLPLRRAAQAEHLAWTVDCFRLSAAVAAPATQVHTHMCYSEFNEIIGAIGQMDADVISIETARSQMELLEAFADYRYPAQIGPGLYDIHSPRVPSVGEMADLLRLAGQRLSPEQLWVNPDCGLKTRGWAEVKPAVAAMVEAARRLRAEVSLDVARKPAGQ